MKKVFLILFLMLVLVSCGSTTSNNSDYAPTKISAETAKEMLDQNSEIILVDVRTKSEYDEGHIEGALLLPLDTISEDAQDKIPNKNKIYIIYCRSGNRSNTASNLLTSMGYAFVYDMGGIIDWPYEIVS